MADIFKGIGIGFDSVLEAYESLPAELQTASNYPPYRITRVNAGQYIAEVNVAGIDRKDVSVTLNDMICRVKVGKEGYYAGADDDTYMVFVVSRFYEIDRVKVDNGVLTISFRNTFKEPRSIKVDFKHESVPAVEVPVEVPTVPVSVQAPVVEEPKVIPTPVVKVAPVLEVPASTETVTTVTVNTEDNTVPTTSVTVPNDLPQVVEAKVEVLPLISTISDAPQAHIELVPATHVSPFDTQYVVPTVDPTKSDIIVIVKSDVADTLEAASIDPVKTIADAIVAVDPVLPAMPAEEVLIPIEAANTVTETAPVAPTEFLVDQPVDAQPVIEPVAEPVVEVISEPVVEAPEPVLEQVVEPVVTGEAVVEALADPVAVEPVVEAVPEAPVATDAPGEVIEPTPEPVVEAPVEVTPEPVVEAPVAPVEEPKVEEVAIEPIPAPTPEPVVEPVVEPTPEVVVSESVVEVTPEPVAEPAPAPEPVDPAVVASFNLEVNEPTANT